MIINDAVVLDNAISGEKWQQYYLYISDLHLDSFECDRQFLKRLLNIARERMAHVLIFGDVFDAMGGKYDPRTNKGHIKPEYQKENYFDLIVEDAVNFLKPYADLIKFISIGNHEYSVTKRHEINLIKHLIKGLGTEIDYGEYTGFIRFRFSRGGGGRSSKVMYYSHGTGGNSPVTRGVIKTNRRSAMIDADYFLSGHIHQSWEVPIPRVRLLNSNRREEYVQEHIQLGTLKKSGKWEKSKDMEVSMRGGYWHKFYSVKDGGTTLVKSELIRAD
jgi:hypothetical protein